MAPKITEVGRWYTLAEIAELEKRVEKQDARIDFKQEELDKKIQDAREEVNMLEREREGLDDDHYIIPWDVEQVQKYGCDLERPNKVDIRAQKELNSFLAQWLKNCIDQGHSLRQGAVVPLQEAA
jgi:hypothetical protein